MSGTLYVVATPLGNLNDLSPRAADTLRRAPVVAAEDTRRTRGLLSHLGASPTLLSYHAHSAERRLEALLDILREGRDIALVTDAGTPAISDPGSDLVGAARQAGIPVIPIPGPSAVAAALSASGIAGDRYLFLGFLPRKGGERARLLDRAASEEWSVVFFEAPHRVRALLDDLRARVGDGRRVVVARELTKLHEEFRAGALTEMIDHFVRVEPRGEFTIVLEGNPAAAAGAAGELAAAAADRSVEARDRATALLADGMTRRAVVRDLIDELGLARNDAYRLVMSLP